MYSSDFNIYPIKKRPAQKQLEEFKSIVTPHINDNMNRIKGASSLLRTYHKKAKEKQYEKEMTMGQIKSGTIDNSWIDEVLVNKGCAFHESAYEV